MSTVLLREIMSLVDKNSKLIPEGDYMSICDKLNELYKEVDMYQPPIRLLVLDPSDEDDDMVEMGSPVAGVGD
jgi:hypothetical protein